MSIRRQLKQTNILLTQGKNVIDELVKHETLTIQLFSFCFIYQVVRLSNITIAFMPPAHF